MPAWRVLVCVALVASAVLGSATADATEPVAASVRFGASGPVEDLTPCNGIAPLTPGCVREYLLTGNFTINIGFAVAVPCGYCGILEIHGFTETGSTTVVCYELPGPVPGCSPPVYAGFYQVDQIWTLVVAASGAGYWQVSVSGGAQPIPIV
jgi:hypothetical protein